MLDKLFRRQKQPKLVIEETYKIRLSDINGLLSTNMEEKLVGFADDMKKSYESLQAEVSNLESNLKALEAAAPADTYDIMTLNRANQTRRALIDKLNSLIRELRKTTKFDFHSMINFNNSCVLALEQVNTNKIKYSNLLDAYFPDQMKILQSSFKSLSDMLANSSNMLSSKEKLMKPVEEVRDGYERLNSEFKQVNKHKEEKLMIEERIQKLKSEHAVLAAELEEIVNSGTLRRFSEAVNRRDLIGNEIKEIKSKAILLISSLDRPLRKFKKLVDLGDEHTEFKKELEMYIDTPFDAVEFDKSQKILDSLLGSVKRCINENKIEMKPPEKILAKIDDIINGKPLAKMTKGLDEMLSEMESLDKYITRETIRDRKLSLEHNISRVQTDIKELGKEQDLLTKKMKELSDSLSVRHLSLKEMLEKIVNRKVELESHPV